MFIIRLMCFSFVRICNIVHRREYLNAAGVKQKRQLITYKHLQYIYVYMGGLVYGHVVFSHLKLVKKQTVCDAGNATWWDKCGTINHTNNKSLQNHIKNDKNINNNNK